MKTINIKDLAEMLSLNVSTVSRALSGHPNVKAETRKRVEEAAKHFNYNPNLHARYFRKKNSSLIALILPDYNMFFYPDLMKGINQVLEENGFSLIVFFSNNHKDKEAEIVKLCLSWVVEAVIISLSENTENLLHLFPLKESGIPVVLVDKVIYSDDFPTVTIDGEAASKKATELLINRGKRKILGLFGKSKMEISKRRAKGFVEVINSHNLDIYGSRAQFVENDIITDYIHETDLKHFDAVFLMSDALLISLYPIVLKNQLFPGKISLIAISDGLLTQSLYPKITHIYHSGRDVGVTAATKAIHMIRHGIHVEHIKVPISLINGDSVF